MKISDTYNTIAQTSEGIYKEKGSKFFSFAFPVQHIDEVKERLDELKKKYFDARHHCYAYILGENSEQFRAYDDGEPGHSAGDPILGQLRSLGLTNTLVVVVRYFGGTKLGISGLIHAYKTAAADALSNNNICRKVILSQVTIQFDYPYLNEVMKLIKDLDLTIMSQHMELKCEMRLGVRLSKEAECRSRLKTLHRITIMPA